MGRTILMWTITDYILDNSGGANKIFYDLQDDVPAREKENTNSCHYSENFLPFTSNYVQHNAILNSSNKQFKGWALFSKIMGRKFKINNNFVNEKYLILFLNNIFIMTPPLLRHAFLVEFLCFTWSPSDYAFRLGDVLHFQGVFEWLMQFRSASPSHYYFHRGCSIHFWMNSCTEVLEDSF